MSSQWQDVHVRRLVARMPWTLVVSLVGLTTATGFVLLATSSGDKDIKRDLGLSLVGSSVVGLVFALVGQIIDSGNRRRAFVMALSEKSDLHGIDLHGQDLSGQYLVGKDLSRGNLVGADLSSANLAGAKLQQANLSGARLQRTVLADADLSGAYLAGARSSNGPSAQTLCWNTRSSPWHDCRGPSCRRHVSATRLSSGRFAHTNDYSRVGQCGNHAESHFEPEGAPVDHTVATLDGGVWDSHDPS
jgi:Pentapeptide repeats (8 copies)